ncbi:hypothetical protein DITRI_Ditri10aG0047600 [Diplodiscus trichospermus]
MEIDLAFSSRLGTGPASSSRVQLIKWEVLSLGWCKLNTNGASSHGSNKAVIKGLELVWKEGYHRVILEVDSLKVLKLLGDGDSGTRFSRNLIFRCKEILARCWEVSTVHILREGNEVTNWLAKYSGSLPLGTHVFDYSPSGLDTLLYADQARAVSPRMIVY